MIDCLTEEHLSSVPKRFLFQETFFIENFSFKEPHITLFQKPGKKDYPGNDRLRIKELNEYLKQEVLAFDFHGVGIARGQDVLWWFGEKGWPGSPSTRFGKIAKAATASRTVKKKPEFNWGNLFRSPEYRSRAMEIKNTILNEGPGGLGKIGLGKDIGKIMALLRQR